MLTIEKTIDKNIITEIVCDSKLWTVQNGQDPNEDQRHYIPDPAKQYLVIKDDHHLVGLFTIRHVTHKLVEGHIRILPSYWGSKMSIEATHMLLKWLKDNTEAINLITHVPANCFHVKRFLDKLGTKVVGLIPDGIIYDHELVDLLIYIKAIREE